MSCITGTNRMSASEQRRSEVRNVQEHSPAAILACNLPAEHPRAEAQYVEGNILADCSEECCPAKVSVPRLHWMLFWLLHVSMDSSNRQVYLHQNCISTLDCLLGRMQ